LAYEPVPVGNRSSATNLGHLASVYYRKKGLDRLQKKFYFAKACQMDLLPRQVGRTVQFFRYNNLAVSTTAKSVEGGVGTSLSTSSRTVSATVSQYTDFINVSDFLVDTAIDPIVQSNAELLGYRAGLSVDTITRAVIDNEQSSTTQALLGSYLKAADFRNSRALLAGADVEPMEDGYFLAISHPYVTFDLVNDPSANGLADITKYTSVPGFQSKPEDRGQLATVAGCRILESTNVALVGGSPNKWRTYVFGKGAVGCVDLEGRGPQRVVDPSKQRFNVSVIKGEKSIYDPEGVIGAAVSYNFIFTTLVLEGPTGIGGTYRFKTLECPSSIVA
jgi:N4-gp56 family major capsid protein